MMEQLSISSFLLNGHEYHLYVYGEMRNVPLGTVIRDGSEILPPSRIFTYRERPSYAGFANYFRYKHLLERGGWWADTAVVCLKPFDFPEDHVFAAELVGHDKEHTANCVIKAPAGSPAMDCALGVCQTKEPERLGWGETGPFPMREVVEALGMERYQQPLYVFCPLSPWEGPRVIDPAAGIALDERAYAIHLWHEGWRSGHRNKNARYPAGCLYEQLMERYLRLPCYG